jgi:hypothetical protein
MAILLAASLAAAGARAEEGQQQAVVEAEAAIAVDVEVVGPMAVDGLFVPMPAEGAPVEDDEARLAPFRAQYLPLVRRELTFANRVCDWTDEQRQAAVEAGRTWLEAYIRTQVGHQQVNQGMMIFMNGGGRMAVQQNAGAAAEDELVAAIRETLDAQQQELYDAELKERRAYRKQTVIDNLVAQFDERLNLTAQQREKLARSLHVRWDEGWAPPLEIFVRMSEYVPVVPDEAITPHLTPDQRKLWAGLQKVSFAGGVNFGQELFPADVGFDEFDLAAEASE